MTIIRQYSELLLCSGCKGVGRIELYDPYHDYSQEEICSQCDGMGMVVSDTVITVRKTNREELQKRMKVIHV